MRVVLGWSDTAAPRDGVKSIVYDVAFKPDGTQLVAACGQRVLIYDAIEGHLLHALKGHKDTVYCVSYSRDGKRFASGGADKTVIIWKSSGEGILKYPHNESIQSLTYNPVTQQLASVTAIDFGLWSPEQKAVAKHKIPARGLCASWTNDGQHIAVGMISGEITIRNRQGIEKVKIERNAPVWSLAWNPSRDEPHDVLAVACWDQTLSFYQLSSTQIGKDRQLDFDPCTVSWFANGEYLLLGGSDRKVSLWTKEGVKLTTVAEKDDWVWCARQRPKQAFQPFVAVGTNSGVLSVHQLLFSTVHGLYQDRYAYRDQMTDVIIQHLVTETKVRIKCRDYVKKIAVYKNRLAVQLPDRVLIYELQTDDDLDMHYKVREKIHETLDCNLLVVTSAHIILCLEKRLQLISFSGQKLREWVLDAVIRYIKGLLVGLKNGQVLKIFVDNPFPLELIHHPASIRCLDLSCSRRKLAVVDDNSAVVVYDVLTRERLFEDTNANSVAWNSMFDETVCYSGKDWLSIKTGSFPVHREKLQGFVVGVRGSKVFCLQNSMMKTVDVPQSAAMFWYLEKKDFENAFKVACLGVTESDWRALALRALSVLEVSIAHKAFIRIRDMRYIEMINKFIQLRKDPSFDDNLFLAEVMAYQGKYQDAAKLYAKANQPHKVIEMFSDLRQYDQATKFGEEYNIPLSDLLRSEAEWNVKKNDFVSAAHKLTAIGDYEGAIKLLGEKGAGDKLMEIVRKLPKTDTANLKSAATYLMKFGQHAYAKEAVMKANDNKLLMQLHVEMEKWDDAFELAKTSPELASTIYLPYANYLMLNDEFEKAQDAFRQAGKPEEAMVMLDKLTHNAVIERRFADASFFFHMLAMETLKLVKNAPNKLTAADQQNLSKFQQLYDRAELYYAYNVVFRYTTEPFTSLLPESVFHTARFLLSKLSPPREKGKSEPESPFGISKSNVTFAVAKQARNLGAFKLARYAYEKLQTLRTPVSWREEVDVGTVSCRALPYSDKEELLSLCYRCSTLNPLLHAHGTRCTNCRHPFVFSFCSFETLPLVEFVLEDGISDDDAEKWINEDSGASGGRGRRGGEGWREEDGGDVQTLRFDDDDRGAMDSNDPFARAMLADGKGFQPIRCNKSMLLSLNRVEIFVVKWPAVGKQNQYFRNMVPDIPVVLCSSCNHFFLEDYEVAYLEHNRCPYCRTENAAA